jgi:hypothetical protein
MIEEQACDVGVEFIPIPSITNIFKTNVGSEYAEILVDVYEKADTSYNEEGVKDNLIKTDRTGWLVHLEYPELHPVLDVFCTRLHKAMTQHAPSDRFDTNIDLRDSWIARSKSGAVVDPHHHGLLPSSWSFCYYAKIPSGKSSITFMDNNLSQKITVHVQEGDLIWFPSHLTHYTVDTEEGRMIYSGNAGISSMLVDSAHMPEQNPDEGEFLDESKLY